MPGTCPRCGPATPLLPGQGTLDEHLCPRCNGRFVPPASTQRVLQSELGHDPAFLRELTAHFGGTRLPCPGCDHAMSPITLRGTPIDLCTGCGGSWLDQGELTRLTTGRHVEVEVGSPAAPTAQGPPDPPAARLPRVVQVGGWVMRRLPSGETQLTLSPAWQVLGKVAGIPVVALAVTVTALMHTSNWVEAVMGGAFLLALFGLLLAAVATVPVVVARPGHLQMAWHFLGLRFKRDLREGGHLEHTTAMARKRLGFGQTYVFAIDAASGRTGQKVRVLTTSDADLSRAVAKELCRVTGWPLEWN